LNFDRTSHFYRKAAESADQSLTAAYSYKYTEKNKINKYCSVSPIRAAVTPLPFSSGTATSLFNGLIDSS